MKVTEQDVLYVAGLANLELTPAERDRMLRDLNSILGHIDSLNEVDTANVEPMEQIAGRLAASSDVQERRSSNTLRADEVGVITVPQGDGVLQARRPSLPREVALQNAPESDGTFFRVPKVIDK
jgi:aspartyl-tRNA(Asn)/glutamyl-tRNA(Gln) amidotransferase subunit C